MRSLASAASLLAAATPERLPSLAAALGFAADPLPLDRKTRDALGLAATPITRAMIVPGEGTLRALLVEVDSTAPLRESVSTVATRLASRAPHLLWLLVAAQRDAAGLALAAWNGERNRPRVAALLVNRERVVPSDAETLTALADIPHSTDTLTHACWLETLGRESLTRRFYRALERVVREIARAARGRATPAERAELALLHVSRLIFLSFLESKGWLNDDHRFLENAFQRCMEVGGEFHRRVLLPLFFGTLNTPIHRRSRAARDFGRVPFLNGGLFARTPLERKKAELYFPDDALGVVFDELLTPYRFTAREESSEWSQAAIDPEMLGLAFESLMHEGERRASGAFYTPHALVARVARSALVDALSGGAVPSVAAESALAGQHVDDEVARALRERSAALRVLDPACGSGAFLVHALEELSALRARLGDPRPTDEIRRELLTRSIFGVDINPMAVWLCELRLWLSVVIEGTTDDPLAVAPLPNLDRHIRVGDSLAGELWDEVRPIRGGASLALLRERYARATGGRKRTLRRALDAAERSAAVAHLESEHRRCSARRRDLISVLRGRDLFGQRVRAGALERQRLASERSRSRELCAAPRSVREGGALPFSWVAQFPDIARRGGFDVVVANPPWVRLHRIPSSARATLRERYSVFRGAAWERGASLARAGPGFAAQVDMAALFTERSLALLRAGGTMALLLPAKLWGSLAGGGVRRLIGDRANVMALEDWSESPAAFDAAVYPSLLVARRAVLPGTEPTRPAPCIAAAVHRGHDALRWEIHPARLALDDPASPWLIIPPAVRTAFDRLARAGEPLAESPFGPPQLGVKCGCNEAFVLRRSDVSGSEEPVERSLLRPLLRGESVAPWSVERASEWLVWTHDESGAPLKSLPPRTALWLGRWRERLAARSDLRPGTQWWSLFRVGAAASSRARVVWADMGRSPRALVLHAGDRTVPLNSCYVLPCSNLTDARAIAALLNSTVAAAWLGVLAEPARGGYRRYMAWTVSLLPLPRDWASARALLAPLAERAALGASPSAGELDAAVLRSYHVRPADVAPLLAWHAR
jgi:methylase of polypeptide subunit release factors